MHRYGSPGQGLVGGRGSVGKVIFIAIVIIAIITIIAIAIIAIVIIAIICIVIMMMMAGKRQSNTAPVSLVSTGLHTRTS